MSINILNNTNTNTWNQTYLTISAQTCSRAIAYELCIPKYSVLEHLTFNNNTTEIKMSKPRHIEIFWLKACRQQTCDSSLKCYCMSMSVRFIFRRTILISDACIVVWLYLQVSTMQRHGFAVNPFYITQKKFAKYSTVAMDTVCYT